MPENLGRYLRHFKPANSNIGILPLDTERDLVTATLKKKRNKLVSHYQAEIDKLHRKLAEVRA
ncbi:hypothetical protein NC651_031044 [Populus alba x Populus x berolinensis]|nr:hypothetical protein NC651_031044 [Populus alba x Populus x berolinensis]